MRVVVVVVVVVIVLCSWCGRRCLLKGGIEYVP